MSHARFETVILLISAKQFFFINMFRLSIKGKVWFYGIILYTSTAGFIDGNFKGTIRVQACVLQGQGHQGIFFLLVLRPLVTSSGSIQGHQGNDQGHGGNRLCCLREAGGKKENPY